MLSTLLYPLPPQTQGAERLDADSEISQAVGHIRIQIRIRAGIREVLHLHLPDSTPLVVTTIVVVHHVKGINQPVRIKLYAPQSHRMSGPCFSDIHNKQNTLLRRQCLLDNRIKTVALQIHAHVLRTQRMGTQLCTEESGCRIWPVCIIQFPIEHSIENQLMAFSG